MHRSRSRQIDSILFKAEACYHNAQFDPNSIDVWHEALAEYDIADISAAFTVHVKQSRFLPTVAEIILIIKGGKDPQISIEARALQQWRVVMSAVRKYGINKPPKFADPGTRRHEKDRPYRVHGFKVSIWRKAFVDRRS